MADYKKVKEREFLLECIQLYRELPSLWNVNSKGYYDRDKKNAAYEILLCKYKYMYPEATKNDVKKKINSLRTNYRKELKKHLQSKKCRSSADDIYKPTLWYYNEMVFLQDQESASDSQSCMDTQLGSILDHNYTQEGDTTTEDDEATSTSNIGDYQEPSTYHIEYDETPSIFNAFPRIKDKNLKKRRNDEELKELRAKRLREEPDEYDNWGLSCASDLKKMEPMQQIFAKNAIAAIIMEGRLGLLHRHSVKINAPPKVMITPKHSMRTRSSQENIIYQQQSDDSYES